MFKLVLLLETDTPSSSQTIKVIQTIKKNAYWLGRKEERKKKKKRRKGRGKDEEGRKGEGGKRREERIKCKRLKEKKKTVNNGIL